MVWQNRLRLSKNRRRKHKQNWVIAIVRYFRVFSTSSTPYTGCRGWAGPSVSSRVVCLAPYHQLSFCIETGPLSSRHHLNHHETCLKSRHFRENSWFLLHVHSMKINAKFVTIKSFSMKIKSFSMKIKSFSMQIKSFSMKIKSFSMKINCIQWKLRLFTWKLTVFVISELFPKIWTFGFPNVAS